MLYSVNLTGTLCGRPPPTPGPTAAAAGAEGAGERHHCIRYLFGESMVLSVATTTSYFVVVSAVSLHHVVLASICVGTACAVVRSVFAQAF